MKNIFNKLIKSYTVEEVRDVIIEVGTSKISWEPVGGRRNNLATINIGTDPAAGVTERITNAIDAVLEKQWKIENEPNDIKSPRRATETWFDIKDGKIASFKDPRDKTIQDLSEKIKVTLYDSNKKDKPTIQIRDKGIGLKPEDFRNTILDLNSSNKINKLHLMGAFGQGGSTALSYNDLTIIISKPYIHNKTSKKVAWTIVRINAGNVNIDKHEWFEYIVEKSTGQPFVLEIPDSEFEPGTLVRHIMMDLGKYKGKMTTPSNSLWYLAHNYLFDAILPFKICDERGDKKEIRTVTGNNRILTYTNNLEYSQTIPLTFKDGKVTIYYWVLDTTGENPKDRITNYTKVSTPIVITFNGQKQGGLGNGIIKNDLKLPFLDRYLIVQIETDYLDNTSKRSLFSSTRESLRDTSILEELKKLTIDTLQEDDRLKQLDKERKERYFRKDETQVLDSLRKRLSRRINTAITASGGGSSVTTSTTGETVNTVGKPEIPIEDPPTFFKIITESPKKVYQGERFSIKFETDAHPNYFKQPDEFIAFIEPQSFGVFNGNAQVVGGHGLAYFQANKDIEIDDTGKITIEIRPPRQKAFIDDIDTLVVEDTSNSDSKKDGKNKMPNLDVRFIDRSNTFFTDNKWNEHSVAEVEESNEEVIILVSAENKNLSKLISRAQRKNSAAVDNIKNKYLEHISFYAFMLKQNENLYLDDVYEEPISENSLNIMRESGLRNASETVCGIINDFFEAIITESVDEDE